MTVPFSEGGRSFCSPLAQDMSDSPTNPVNHSAASVTRQLQLVLQPLEPLLCFLVVQELVHRLLHVFGAIRDRRQMFSVFCDEETILILTEVNDGRACASRDLRRVSSHVGDGLLLPGKYGIAYPLQLGSAFPHRVDVALDSVQVVSMALPVELGVPGKGPQCLRMERESRGFLLDLCEERRSPP